MIRLVGIDERNWCIQLKVTDTQKTYVASSMDLLARTYAYRSCLSRAFLIMEEETPVGMGLYYDLPDLNAYDLSQIFIDTRYQGKGYDKAATQQILDALRADGRFDTVVLCSIVGNTAAA